MADYVWPADIVPYAVTFYLQAHSGGSESPFSRQTKVYGLSAPRWVCRMSFRGGYSDEWGTSNAARLGPTLDALLARLRGRQNRVGIYDFRRPYLRGVTTTDIGNEAATAGASSLVLTGLVPGEAVLAGDYVGGDGRPHIIVQDVAVLEDGTATVQFEPPLYAAIGVDDATYGTARGWFRLTSDDAGVNPSEVGQLTTYDLEFVEDRTAGDPITPNTTLTINNITILIGDDEVEMA